MSSMIGKLKGQGLGKALLEIQTGKSETILTQLIPSLLLVIELSFQTQPSITSISIKNGVGLAWVGERDPGCSEVPPASMQHDSNSVSKW